MVTQNFEDIVFLTFAFVFIVMGLLSFSWIQFRFYQNLKTLLTEKINIFNSLIFLSSCGLLAYWVMSFYKLIFNCMFGLAHCSASKNGEVIILVSIAFAMIMYEIILFVLNFLKRKVYESKI